MLDWNEFVYKKTTVSPLKFNVFGFFFFNSQDREMSHQQSPCGDSMVGAGDGGKEVEGGVDQFMGLGETETVGSNSAFEQWDTYWEDLTRYIRQSCASLVRSVCDFNI